MATAIIACKPNENLLINSQTSEEWRDITDIGLTGINTGNIFSLNQNKRSDSDQNFDDIHYQNSNFEKFDSNFATNQKAVDNGLNENDDSISNVGRTQLDDINSDINDNTYSSDQVNESVAIDKTWLNANQKDKCPKLVRFRLGSTKIIRKNEVMQDSHCDYYIYPNKGNIISVSNYPHNIEASLITPDFYNFANGSYLVKEADKYVIRLTYDGTEYKDHSLTYNVTIEVN